MRAVNAVADTISLAEAQSIFSLNVIGSDTNKIFVKLTVNDWDLFLKNGADTVIYRGRGEKLSTEMKNALKKIRPGAEIYFERINAMWGEIPVGSVKMIKYVVKE